MVDTAYLEIFQDEDLFALVDAVHKSCDASQMEMKTESFSQSFIRPLSIMVLG